MVELETHERLGQDLREDGLRIRDIEHEGAASRVVDLTDLEDQHRVGLGTATANHKRHRPHAGEVRTALNFVRPRRILDVGQV